MLNVTEQTKAAFDSGDVLKSVRIYFPNIDYTLTNENIVSESLKLTQSIQSGTELDFIGCNASTLSFDIEGNVYELAGQRVEVYIKAGQTEEIPLFCGIVDKSSKKGINETTKTITAYDDLKVINEADVTTWYKGLTFPITIKNMRNSFFAHFGINQESINLINDDIPVRLDSDAETVSGKQIINAICQFNACFGQMSNAGKFKYIYLDVITEGLYPADNLYPEDDLYPSSENSNTYILQNQKIIDCKYEDFRVPVIDKVVLISADGTIGGQAGTGQNTLKIESNLLTRGLNASQFSAAAQRIFGKVKQIWYGVAEVSALGNPIYECGDVMAFRAKSDIMRGYILSRRLKGIQSLVDTFTSEGDTERSTQFNNIQSQIDRLNRQTVTNTETIASQGNTIASQGNTIASQGNTIASQGNTIASQGNRIGSLEADHVSVNDLSATNARIGTIEANYITAGTVAANYATISSLNAVSATVNTINANYITAGYITTDVICSKLNSPNAGSITLGTMRTASMYYFNGSSYELLKKKTKTISGQTIVYWGFD